MNILAPKMKINRGVDDATYAHNVVATMALIWKDKEGTKEQLWKKGPRTVTAEAKDMSARLPIATANVSEIVHYITVAVLKLQRIMMVVAFLRKHDVKHDEEELEIRAL